ncbi:PREDICTED: cell division control protein 6 homolog [Dinoponera quadriceps]|uniref:Cell division control protein 6 homolog n=1 Tax=Dinoponera quadriceps TaxID=609295 RepID=A0A6P3X156_DINQU|nr:PREDICTED: cell division control protein 6 homolog [Dinoponera quadriceps]
MSVQSTISFPIRKKWNFYGHKKDVVKEDFSEATAKGTPTRYTPTVKKIVTLISSESESDSDIENTVEGVTRGIESKVAQTSPHRKRNNSFDEENVTSPSKQRKNQLLQALSTPSTLLNRLNVSPKKGENMQFGTPTHRKHNNGPNEENITSPSKQRKNQLLQASLTPSTLLNRLNLSPKKEENLQPETPTHQKRYRSSNEEPVSLCSPSKQKKGQSLQTSSTPSTLVNKLNFSPDNENNLLPRRLFESNQYQDARLALHSSETEDLPGREKELDKLQEFLRKHLEEETSGSLYISGPPGTGKTASLSKIMQQPEFKSQFKSVYVNCTTMKSAPAIYEKIIQELSISKSGKNKKANIEKYLKSKHKMLLLVLDEIDQLESRKQAVLYSIFEWPSLMNSKLILIGVANALDLTDRILPRLQARCELKPTLMHFASYTKQQIVDIISMRLSRANAINVLPSTAIQLLAGKVAAVSGDIRRALDISRRVIELAESGKVAEVLRPTNDNNTNTEDSKKQTEVTERPVDLKEVVTVLNGVYGSTQNCNKDTFPIQQKLLLCSLLLILNKGRNKDVTVGMLHEVYKKVCKKRNISAADFSEFLSMCLLIETRGTLRIVGKNQSRLFKVSLQWDQSELDSALQDKDMMAEIINDTSCL